MKLLYLDSSAVVKLYKPETQSIRVRRLVDGADDCATSALAEVEVCGARARAVRGAQLDPADAERLRALFLDELSRMTLVFPIHELIRHSAALAERHYLRAYDAVHLASALRLGAESGEVVHLLAFDDALNAVAVAEGLTLPG